MSFNETIDAIESIAIVPNSDQAFDELWCVVNRANGRFIERMALRLEAVDCGDDRTALAGGQIFLDSALTYDDPIEISAIDSVGTSTIVSTEVAHGLSSGDIVVLSCAGDFDGRYELREVGDQSDIALLVHAESDFTDSSVNNHTPTLVNTPTITTSALVGEGSGSFDFNDYVTYPNHSSFNISTNANYLIRAVVKITSLPSSFTDRRIIFGMFVPTTFAGIHCELDIYDDGFSSSNLYTLHWWYPGGGDPALEVLDVELFEGVEYEFIIRRVSNTTYMELDGVVLAQDSTNFNGPFNMTNDANIRFVVGVADLGGNAIRFSGIIDEVLFINGRSSLTTTYAPPTPFPDPFLSATGFEIVDATLGTPIDSSTFTAFEGTGYARLAANQFTGLDHLEGEEVGVLGDGEYLGEETVVGGSISLASSYGSIVAGLPYNCDLITQEIERP